MVRLADDENCTGCMACYNICPKNAIIIKKNKEGFNFPAIQADVCIECNKCANICPIENFSLKTFSYARDVYGVWSKEKSILRSSSSGGFFSILSKWILMNGGCVVGAAFDSHFNVDHVCVNTEAELVSLRGSKYIQSNINYIYREVEQLLKIKKSVLFTGTPCQIAGLYAYLGKEYENLLTMDLVCHGVPTPQIFQEYKKWLEKNNQAPMVSYTFRDKKWSWMKFNTKAKFANGKIYYGTWEEDIYMRGFLREYFLRSSCHNCRFSNTNRVGDITIADFWGYEREEKEKKNRDAGISLIIVNTVNGMSHFDKIKRQLYYYPKRIEDAVRGNKALSSCFLSSPLRKQFWQDYAEEGFEKLIDTYLYPEKVEKYYKRLYYLGKRNPIFKMINFLGRIKRRVYSITK